MRCWQEPVNTFFINEDDQHWIEAMTHVLFWLFSIYFAFFFFIQCVQCSASSSARVGWMHHTDQIDGYCWMCAG